MAACKYCGQETGGSMFCQNCGAKVEVQDEQPVMQQPAYTPNPFPTQPMANTIPTQPSFYTPGGAGGLLAGNIIAIVLGVICCCFTYGISLIAMILGIIGTVYASKVKSSLNADEERHNRRVSRILMIIAYVVLVLGLVAIIGLAIAASDGISGFKEMYESIYESVSVSMENANK